MVHHAVERRAHVKNCVSSTRARVSLEFNEQRRLYTIPAISATLAKKLVITPVYVSARDQSKHRPPQVPLAIRSPNERSAQKERYTVVYSSRGASEEGSCPSTPQKGSCPSTPRKRGVVLLGRRHWKTSPHSVSPERLSMMPQT